MRSKAYKRRDAYTPPSAMSLKTRLRESEEDLKASRVDGPFDTHEAMMAFLEDNLARHRQRLARKRSRR